MSMTNSYGDWIDECDRRVKAGQQQAYCPACGLWKWDDEKCCNTHRTSAKDFKAHVDRLEAEARRYEKAKAIFDKRWQETQGDKR